MCFSAAASFSASAFLGVTGVLAIRNVKNRAEYPLALIPIFFAIQQLLEGFIWLSLPAMQIRATFLSIPFLFLALFWWQFYMPFTAALIEKDPLRKIVLQILMVLGLGSGGFLFYNAFIHLSAPSIVGESIHYSFDASHTFFFLAMYGISSFGAAMLSSDRFLRLFGFLLFISALITAFYYEVNYASVWCYFGATLSVILAARFILLRKKR